MIPKEFYPTPTKLLDKITMGVDWKILSTVLEPSAGKGNIVDYIKEKYKSRIWNNLDIDCIEIDKDLRNVLKGKEYRVIHDDFLTFHTFKKYDLIIMNPPFSSGSTHLMKALDMQKDGGNIICILNAETIKNPYTNERKVLIKRLNDIGAEIQYLQNEFITSERPTGVEIAVIKAYIKEPEYESYIYERLKKKTYVENNYQEITDLMSNDFIEAIVGMYNLEVESGISLIREYKALSPHIMTDIKEDMAYNRPILNLTIGDERRLSVNQYVKMVRIKYWNALFRNPKFISGMTSNLATQYYNRIDKLSDYDFSIYNIHSIQIDMSKNLIKGIEDCIIELFDKLSYQYSYSDELSGNIHYYNGWKTNKAWYINKKVILPYMNAFDTYDKKFRIHYQVENQLRDIEKALNYLDGGLTECRDMDLWLRHAEKTGQTKKIKLKYFYVTFYKKGTCHIEFTNEDLLKKLNIFGSQQKRWLPYGYGKKTYDEMQPEEKAIIDEFEGKEEYEKTIERQEYFIYNPKTSISYLEMK